MQYNHFLYSAVGFLAVFHHWCSNSATN